MVPEAGTYTGGCKASPGTKFFIGWGNEFLGTDVRKMMVKTYTSARRHYQNVEL